MDLIDELLADFDAKNPDGFREKYRHECQRFITAVNELGYNIQKLSDPKKKETQVSANGTATQKSAAAAAFPRSGTQRMRVLKVIAAAGATGRTDEEVQKELGEVEGALRTRRKELEVGGWVQNSGALRRSEQNQDVIVWTLTPAARAKFGPSGASIW